MRPRLVDEEIAFRRAHSLKTLKDLDVVLTVVEELARPPCMSPEDFRLLSVEPVESALPVLTPHQLDLIRPNHKFGRELLEA